MSKRHTAREYLDGQESDTNLFVKQKPDSLPEGETGMIMQHARRELDVSLSQVSQFSGLSHNTVSTFEEQNYPLSLTLWKSYVTAVRERHELSMAKASGLLRGLVNEINYYNDHKRFQ